MVYQHYKGAKYRLIHQLVYVESQGEDVPHVAYMSMDDGRIWIRPQGEFFSMVDISAEDDLEQKFVPRFQLVA